MYWNHRLVIDSETSPGVVGVCEVFYDNEDKPCLFGGAAAIYDLSVDGHLANAPRSIRIQLEQMVAATRKPVLIYPEDFVGKPPS